MSTTLITSKRTRWLPATVIGAGAALVVALIVAAFLWPTVTSSVKNLPVGVVGDAAAVAGVDAGLHQNAAGVFSTLAQDSRDEAIASVQRRETYGAIIAGPSPEVLVAGAASPSVSAILRQVAETLQQQTAARVAAAGGDASSVSVVVTDVVPLVEADPNGSALAAVGFPLTLGGIAGGVLISLLVTGVGRRLVALAMFTVVSAGAIAFLTHTWFGILPAPDGTFSLAAAIAVSLLGTASFVVGANAVLRTAGIAVGASLTMLVANPISAATVPVQYLVEPWGVIGQFFVPGAAATLVRDLAYFPAADATRPWLVLIAWAALGVVLSALGHFRNREVVHLEAIEEDAPLTPRPRASVSSTRSAAPTV
ncbi:hypothetical protein SAMN04487848_2817 [Microbacterium sp. ru370.1]|uniref:hypothetical protein n=1 Tax=unclassified Microbacterium TaxID=2609290 RepID=UPI00088E25B5|nr:MULTISPECIES: hypothetical protein [unclassified Microbacterium]SDO97980.1 hypothetical protein SAMN04487848_2817 [Microbacterium sp. ru370.1]SIT92651.1 hypothetical protein SAMN05880579_2763 [Microbacterium sp. RU1D]